MTNFSTLIVFLGIPLFFLPKINLVAIAGETAGIRVDDLVIATIFILVLLFRLAHKSLSTNRFEVLVFLYVGSALISVAYNESNLFYALRMLEYFVFFYVGAIFSLRGDVTRLCLVLLIAQTLVMVGQAFGVVGGFTVLGYDPSTSERVIGLTAGPWELGIILNFLLAVLLFGQEKAGLRYSLLLFSFTTVLLGLTGARAPFVAHLYIYAAWFLGCHKSYITGNRIFEVVLLAGFAAALIALSLVLQQGENSLAARLNTVASVGNIEMIENLVDRPLGNCGRNELEDSISVESGNVDPSWNIRAQKWAIVASCFPVSWLPIFVGSGPGRWGPAVDGGWLRLVSENGLLGFGCFISLLWLGGKVNRLTATIAVALAINMVFIDAHISYKAMSLYFFILGYSYALRLRSNEIQSTTAIVGLRR